MDPLVFFSRTIRAMPVVMTTNSLGQFTLNSSPIFTTATGTPITMGNASGPPKLVIQALPAMMPAGSKAGEKITIITIPANQLASLLQGNPSGLLTQLIQAKPIATQMAQATAKPTATTVQLTAARPGPHLILAKPAAVAQPLPQLAVQVSTSQPSLTSPAPSPAVAPVQTANRPPGLVIRAADPQPSPSTSTTATSPPPAAQSSQPATAEAPAPSPRPQHPACSAADSLPSQSSPSSFTSVTKEPDAPTS